MNEPDEDEEIMAVSERHSQIMKDGDSFFTASFFIGLALFLAACGVIAAELYFGFTP